MSSNKAERFANSDPPVAIILAGPNGAGKTTVSSRLIGDHIEFVNADVIAAELTEQDKHRVGVDVAAGRIVLGRLSALTAERSSFCLETNLASRGLLSRIDQLRGSGYRVELIFVSLPDVDLALARVAARVAAGGHAIDEATVRRRFNSGLRLFFDVYLDRVNRWSVYDNSRSDPRLLARCKGLVAEVLDEESWTRLRAFGSAELLAKSERIDP